MHHADCVVIGAGQAGLAMSHCLTDRGVDHVVLERGRVAERWRSERWDSLRLLTPNWQSRLPGFHYDGADPDGYMTMPEVVDYFERYATSFAAPVRCGTEVRAVTRTGDAFRVETTGGDWLAATVVIATGYADRPAVPRYAPRRCRTASCTWCPRPTGGPSSCRTAACSWWARRRPASSSRTS